MADEEPNDTALMAQLVEATCNAVCGYIGVRWGWAIVSEQYRGSREREFQRAYDRMPMGSRQIIVDELKRSGWTDKSAERVLRLVSLTRRQQEARTAQILAIAFRCMENPDWLKR